MENYGQSQSRRAAYRSNMPTVDGRSGSIRPLPFFRSPSAAAVEVHIVAVELERLAGPQATRHDQAEQRLHDGGRRRQQPCGLNERGHLFHGRDCTGLAAGQGCVSLDVPMPGTARPQL